MRGLNERMNDNVIIVNVGGYAVSIATQDKPEGIIIDGGKNISILVKDLLSTLRGNKFIYGVDERGTNAILYIDEPEIRELLGFDEYTTKDKVAKDKDDKDVVKTEKKLTKEQIVLSKEVFIKRVKVQANAEFITYANSLKDVSSGCKMMVARFILDERKGKLKGVSISRFDDLEAAILH